MAQEIRSSPKGELRDLCPTVFLIPLIFRILICVNCINECQEIWCQQVFRRLELTHTDICRPFPKVSWNGQQYFITFIDDFSRYGYLYLIHEKSQSLDVFKNYKAEVEN